MAVGGGRSAGAPRTRGSRAAPCSTGPATTMPRMPIARARVSVSASTREPTTRIVPADPTSRPPARSSLSVAGLEAAAGRAAERHDAADAAAGGADGDRRSRADLADDARERRLERVGDVARGDPPAAAPLEHVFAGRQRGVAAAARGPVQRRPGRGSAVAGTPMLVEARVAQPLRDRRPDDDRIAGRRPAAGRPGASRKIASTGAVIEPARRDEAEVAAGAPSVARSRRRPAATTRAARRAGRPDPAARAARRAGRAAGHRGRR